MTFKEFRGLAACMAPLFIATVTGNREKFDAVVARSESIHAQIDARKAAAGNE